MNTIDIEELKRIQLCILEAVHRFCISNGIKYSMACGTMLGAVRHKGYIPWDDDIDIYLLRKDYENLIRLFPKVYEEHFEIISLERDNSWNRPYAKAFDNRTLYFENSRKSSVIGVNIDVYPIDDVPDDEAEWKRYDKERRYLQNINSVINMRFDKRRGVWKNCLLFFYKGLTILLNRRRYACFLSRFAQKYNGNGGRFVFECVQGMLQKNRFHKTLFDELCEYQFENKVFLGFRNYDEYLKNGYGDYWRLPPEEKRVSHHSYTAIWKDQIQ